MTFTEFFKKCLKSKTIWLGLSQIVTAFGLYFTGEQSLTEVLLGTSGVFTIIFRLVTTEPIENKNI